MAIKGKTRSKNRPRTAARAPRAVPVEVKPPFFLRRWVQVSLAAAAGVAAMIVLIWATNGLRNEHRTNEAAANRAKAVKALGQWKSTVDSALTGVQFDEQSQSVGMFSSISTALDQIKGGKIPKSAVTQVSSAEKPLKTAADDLEKAALPDMIRDKGLTEAQAITILDSRSGMVNAFRIEQEVAATIESAAKAPPSVASDLIADAKMLSTLAQSNFGDAYQSYVGILRPLGLIPVTQPTIPPGGFPGGGPGGIPGGVPGG